MPPIRRLIAVSSLTALLAGHPPAQEPDTGTSLEALRERLERNEYDAVLAESRRLLEDSQDDPAVTVEILDLMVRTFRDAGRATDPEARVLAERAIRLRERIAGPEDPSVAYSLSLLGALLSRAGELDDAVAAHRRALAIREKTLPADDPMVAETLDNLSDVLQKQAAYDEALENYRTALRIYESAYGPDHLEVAKVLSDMGNLGIRMGDYVAARERYERAMAIYTANLEPGHRNISLVKITLGYLLVLTGDLERARELLEQAAAETEKNLGADHPLTLAALNNLGTALFTMGDFAGARPVFAKVLTLRERTRGAMHYETADAALNLGASLRELGNNEEALLLYEKARTIYVEKLGPGNPRVAEILVNIGNTYLDSGEIDEALPRYERSLEIRLATVGRNHPATARSHELMAGALLAAGNRDAALDHVTAAASILDRHTRETVAYMPEREALLMVAAREKPEALLFHGLVADDEDSPAWLRACWEWALRSRALVLDELARRNRAVPEDGAARSAFDELSRVREAIAELWVKGAGESEQEFDSALATARARREKAEMALARVSSEFRSDRRTRNAGLQEVRAALSSSSVLVEYARVEVGTPTMDDRAERYFALVLAKDGEMRHADLGPAEAIDRLVADWRDALESAGRDLAAGKRGPGLLSRVEESGARLRVAIWDPVMERLEAPREIYLVPDGALHNVDFNALPRAGGGFLIEDDRHIHLLDSGRDLVRIEELTGSSGTSSHGLLALGAPDFGSPVEGSGGASGRESEGKCDPRQGSRWPDLPESAREVETVGRLLGGDDPVKLLTGKAAGEAAFKKLAPGSDILHMATHGFFLHGACEGEESSMNPLLLSGLVLAGANDPAEEEMEDGYLTAEELAALDLRGVSLAVLSGCDTGRGRIESGEGVLGLRRSLALAGARTIIMSLWRVPDREARRWMTSFYEARVSGSSISRAVRQAGLGNLERLRDRGIPAHPYLWAGFVATGDWR